MKTKSMKKPKKPTKKLNPQDSTLRNIRALKKRVTKLEALMDVIIKWLTTRMPYETFAKVLREKKNARMSTQDG